MEIPRLNLLASWSQIRGTMSRIPKGNELIWWLIDKQKKPQTQILAFVFFLGMFTGVFYLTYKSAERAFLLAVAVLVQMYCHELGHAAVFVHSNVATQVLLLMPLGAVAAPQNREEDAKSDRLPWFVIACLAQAGITVNVLLMGVGVLLKASDHPLVAMFGSQLIFAGGILAVSNLFPVWQLDGKLLFKTIFSSLREMDEKFLSIGLTAVGVVSMVLALQLMEDLSLFPILINVFRHSAWIIVIVIVVAGVWHQQGLDDPGFADSAQAMTRWQAVAHVMWYLGLIYMSLYLIAGPLMS